MIIKGIFNKSHMKRPYYSLYNGEAVQESMKRPELESMLCYFRDPLQW